MRKEREIPPYEPQRYWKPEQVIQFYKDHDQPLSRSTIAYHLLNLTGTSFLRVAVEGIRAEALSIFHRNYPQPNQPTDAANFYASLTGMNTIDYLIGKVTDEQRQARAIATLQTALLSPILPTDVYEYETIRPDEMVVDLWRTDDVFTDASRQNRAYRHLARQVHFFKQGVLVDALALSTIFYHLSSGHAELHSILLEGLYEVSYYTDPARKPLVVVAPELQRYNDTEETSHTSLFIGTQFDANQARYREQDA